MNNTSLWLFWLLYLCFRTFLAPQTYGQYFLLAIMSHLSISVLLTTFLITLKKLVEKNLKYHYSFLLETTFILLVSSGFIGLKSTARFLLFLICGGLFWLICFFVIRILPKARNMSLVFSGKLNKHLREKWDGLNSETGFCVSFQKYSILNQLSINTTLSLTMISMI